MALLAKAWRIARKCEIELSKLGLSWRAARVCRLGFLDSVCSSCGLLACCTWQVLTSKEGKKAGAELSLTRDPDARDNTNQT